MNDHISPGSRREGGTSGPPGPQPPREPSVHAAGGLARAVQYHVPEQPQGRCGREPVDVELFYNARYAATAWRVRFVAAIKGGRRVWEQAAGPTVEAALEAARKVQAGYGPQPLIRTLSGDVL